MKPCPECHLAIADNCHLCPHCGRKTVDRTSIAIALIIGIIIIVIIAH